MKVVIVGAGPVGLYLGCLVRQLDLECTILERRVVRSTHSRSVGVHPPALRRLDDLGIAHDLIERGVTVRTGVGLIDGKQIGTLSFEQLPQPFNFVLTVPQHITESLLEDRFLELGGRIERGHEVTGLEQDGPHVAVTTRSEGADRNGGPSTAWTADRLVACDGRHGSIRDMLGTGLRGAPYDDHYVMGDFPDTTAFGHRAAIYLDRRGVVECFPLPGDVRRWVARVEEPVRGKDQEVDALIQAVADRTGLMLETSSSLMRSAFTAERFEAERFFVGGVALAGDAAHVISPIGGQGMNLGWMDADWLGAWFGRGAPTSELSRYESERKRAFRRAARRAELNMFMGRSGALFPIRRSMAHAMLSKPLQRTFVRLFTMDGI